MTNLSIKASPTLSLERGLMIVHQSGQVVFSVTQVGEEVSFLMAVDLVLKVTNVAGSWFVPTEM